MADEVSITNNGDLRIAAILNKMVYRKLNDHVDLRSLCMRVDDPAGRGTLVTKIPQVDFNEVMSTPGEAAEVSNSALEDATFSVTAARHALRYDVTDEFSVSNSNTNYGDIAQGIVDAYIRKTTTMIGELLDDFSTVAGSTGVALTVDDILSAMLSLEDADNDGQFSCALTRKQFADFRTSLQGIGGPFQFRNDTSNMLDAKNMQGYMGTWANIDFYTSNLLYNDGTDDFGAMFTPGALAYTEPNVAGLKAQMGNAWSLYAQNGSNLFVEIERAGTYAITKLIGHGYFGIIENDDERGVTIQSLD